MVVRLSRTASDVSSRPGEALSREDALGERGDGSQNASQSAVSLSTRDNETGRRTLLLLRETLLKLGGYRWMWQNKWETLCFEWKVNTDVTAEADDGRTL